MMRPRLLLFALLLALPSWAQAAAESPPDALIFLIADQHSAYDRTAQLVAHVDAVRAAYPKLPIAILIDGDVFERGNAVALRTNGAIDFAMLAALAERAPTVLNLGNHEAEFFDLAETVRRIAATGVKVLTNASDRATGKPFAPASLRLPLGLTEAVIVGFITDRLATFRPEVRPSLTIPEPVAWAKANLPALLTVAPVKIVLSHAGLRADRDILPTLPNGTLLAGAHDHLRFVHREDATVYVHSGSWNEYVTQAWLHRSADGVVRWDIEQIRLSTSDAADPKLAATIRAVKTAHLTAADTAVVGRTPHAYAPAEAERFVVEAMRAAAKTDVAFVGHTTFGAGLPAGDVTRVAFDACVRFDGTLFTGEIDGIRLQHLLAHANQNSETPWSERADEYLVAVSAIGAIEPQRRYRIAVTDWIARDPERYLGAAIPLRELPTLRLKAIAARALDHP
jgi:5'-nucleotidase / UDP-sugar diphosphatase